MLKLVRIAAIGLLLGLSTLAQAPLTLAQDDISSDDIVNALTPKEASRGLKVT